MPIIEASLYIPAPPEAVWQVVSDASRAPAWMPDIKERRLISRPPLALAVSGRTTAFCAAGPSA
jgi:uncharacterized protein YndB with AHSA1/START domain